MVCTGTKSGKDEEKISFKDVEIGGDAVSFASIIDKHKRKPDSLNPCVVLPWLLLLICFMMLACVSSWGWREHFRAEELLAKAQKVASTPLVTMPEDRDSDTQDVNVVELNVIEENTPVKESTIEPMLESDNDIFLPSSFSMHLPLGFQSDMQDPWADTGGIDSTAASVKRLELPTLITEADDENQGINAWRIWSTS